MILNFLFISKRNVRLSDCVKSLNSDWVAIQLHILLAYYLKEVICFPKSVKMR